MQITSCNKRQKGVLQATRKRIEVERWEQLKGIRSHSSRKRRAVYLPREKVGFGGGPHGGPPHNAWGHPRRVGQ